MGGTAPTASNLDQILFKVDGSAVTLNYQPSSAKTVVVSSATSSKELQRFNLDGQRLECPVENPLQTAAIFKIEVLGEKNCLLAIPGLTTAKAKPGEGSIRDLALALASHYRVPVVVESSDVTHHVSWTFTSTDAWTAANQAVVSEHFSVDQRPDGLIEIR